MSAWGDFITTALIGTEKSPSPALPDALEQTVTLPAEQEAGAKFLTRAGAFALWRKAGWKPPRVTTSIPPAQPEECVPLGNASVMHLRLMLGGHCATVLPEWLGEAAQLRRLLPPELLPALLERARQERALRPHALAAGGKRAHWLAAQNPDWSFAAREEPALWETGDRDQRTAFLRALRAADPAGARIKIEAVWNVEAADVRTAFVSVLEENLSMEDAPFLESLLGDRSKEVRRAAIDLLARLEASPFVARMTERAAPLLAFKRGGLLSRASLEVTLPADPDAAATRDGLDPKAFGQQKTLGEKAVVLVLLLSAVPLRHWTETTGQTPPALLKALEKNEFARAIATGWAWAALRQKDAAWAGALLDGGVEPHLEFLPAEPLLAVLPESERATRLAAMVRAGGLKKGGNAEWQSLTAQLDAFAGHWPPPLAREVLAALRGMAVEGIPWHLRAVVVSLLLRLPPSLLPEAVPGWPDDKEGVAAISELLAFRQNSLTALNQT